MHADTAILDEKAIAEIEREPWMHTYNDDRVEAPLESRRVAITVGQRDALCQTVRAAWEQLAHVQSKTHYLVCGARIEALEHQLARVEQDRGDLRIAVEIATEEDADVALSKLHKVQHEALRNQECDALRELRAIKADALNVLVAAERHAINDFRTRATQLCRDKAAEFAPLGIAAKACNEIAAELEKL